jgi:branched-chain amino acid transport system permease protein
VRRAGPAVAVLVAALLVPLARPGSFTLHVLILVAFWTLLGAAWNVLGGLAGQVSFGHAALVGVGAYTTMILYLKLGIAPWWGVLAGSAAAALVSVPVGLLCFRLRGPYFSLATLAVAELVKLVALNFEALTNGAQGFLITALPPVSAAGHALDWESKAPFYVAAVLLAALGLASTAWLRGSRLGAWLVAIREDEDAAEAIGIDTVRAKVLTLAHSAALAGLGGGFYAVYFRYVDPDAVCNLGLSMEMVFIAMVGGLGTVAGPLAGAVFLTALGELVRERFGSGHLVVYGLFMMLVIRFMPDGIWGRVRRLLARPGRAAADVALGG